MKGRGGEGERVEDVSDGERRDAPTAREPVAVIHGRFQPLHVGHLEYLLAGKALCNVLLVGITNPDPWLTRAEPADPERGDPRANPCTYYERQLMVEGTLLEAGISPGEFRVVPFPHSYPERLRYYAPPRALYLLSIYDAWGDAKLARFQQLGLRTHVLWRRSRKVTSGAAIRDLIGAGGAWRPWVPPATARVINEFAIDVRIREGLAGVSGRRAPWAGAGHEP